jgi:hypothetical protein
MVYAFGLLEILCLTNLKFVFKGGTSLIFLLKEPRRFSTDIDILVSSQENLDIVMNSLKDHHPFTRFEEQYRKPKGSNIKKRHFKFYYDSPVLKLEMYILLDVLIEENEYLSTKTFEIKSDFILLESFPTKVSIPKAECLLGDKLAAFAPKTTGILFGKDKSMEIIKQFYDIGVLFEVAEDFDLVLSTYMATVKTEIRYRNLDCSIYDVLSDSFNASLSISSRGKYGYIAEFREFELGIQRIKGHIFYEKFTMEKAVLHACEILYIYARLIKNEPIHKIDNFEKYKTLLIENPDYNSLNRIKKISLRKFAYVYEAVKSLI